MLSQHAWMNSACSFCLLSLFVLCFGGQPGGKKKRKRGKTGQSCIKEMCEKIAHEVPVNNELIKFPCMF